MSCLANATQRLVRTTNVPATFTMAMWAICNPSTDDTACSIDTATTYAANIFVVSAADNNWHFFSTNTGDIDLGVASTSWTFLCCSRTNNTNNATKIYTGTGGALTVTSPTYTGTNITPNRISVYNEVDTSFPFRGNVLSFKLWDVVLTQAEVENEYLRLVPTTQLVSLNTWLPILNNTNAVTDWSGNARDMTKTGTFTDSHLMPPVPWRGWR